MQRRRHAPHHVVADEHGEHEDGELREEVVAALGRLRRESLPRHREIGQHGRREEDEARIEGPSRHGVLPPLGLAAGLGWRFTPVVLAGVLADVLAAVLAAEDLVVARAELAGLGLALAGLPPRRSATIALTTAPSRAMAVPLASSSSQSMASVFFSLSMNGSMNACRLRA